MAISTLQRTIRGHLTRKRLRAQRDHIRNLQSLCRRWLVRQHLQRQHAAATTIQRTWRAHRERRRFLSTLSAVLFVQTRCRSFLARKRLAERRATLNGAAVTIQKAWRGFLARQEYAKRLEAIRTIQRAWRDYCITGKQATQQLEGEVRVACLRTNNRASTTPSSYLRFCRRC